MQYFENFNISLLCTALAILGGFAVFFTLIFGTSKPVIIELWCYPIKGCKGISLSGSKISNTGLQYDRIFMLVDSNGKFITQRTHPEVF
jgi:hypothetical protein